MKRGQCTTARAVIITNRLSVRKQEFFGLEIGLRATRLNYEGTYELFEELCAPTLFALSRALHLSLCCGDTEGALPRSNRDDVLHD
jgi:hypothetical protein